MNTRTKLFISIMVVLITTITAISQPDSLWSRRYDMTISGSKLLHNGNYAITGWSSRENGVFSVVSQLDTEGDIIWRDNWQDRYGYKEAVATPDSAIAICGYRDEVVIIKKYNLDGDQLYSWEFEFRYEPEITSFLSDGNGGYAAAGHAWTSNNARYDFMLFRVSPEGELEWQRVYDDRPRDQECFAMAAIPDGGYLLVGYTRENNFGNEINVIRTDEEGEEIWRNHYGTELLDIPANEGGYDIIATEDGNFIIVGQTLAHNNQNGAFNVIMLKIDSNGEALWMKTIDLGGDEKARSIASTLDGGFVMSGFSSENFDITGNPFIMKTDHRGNLIWSYIEENVRVGGVGDVIAHEDRTFSLIAQTNTGLKGFLQKFGRDPHGVADGGDGFMPYWTGLESAYPNPFNSITTFVFTVGSPATVGIDIFNALGRRQAELVRRSYPVGQYRLSWDAGGLPSGEYFARMTAGGFAQTVKLMLIK